MAARTKRTIIFFAAGAVLFSALSYICPLVYWMYTMSGYYGMVVPGFLPPKISIHRGIWGSIFTPTRRIRLPKLSG